ncbi:hypothetical protein DOX53_05065 [Cronobacter malonaticus]|uniref:Uncharacterized protein n=1 Tax=Cronobacter malonaticus TaxID=413503 RepID=A0ABX5K6B6_9ENTR|nr:hypothetical protein AFK66_021380 [Cronobacter malonaticus LMG 23826]EGT4280177.1 hypothetical protein [Cronobacter malonaticus]CCJ93520.1 hypothetical protein BN131_1193 [Cronobacter malonaticus 681]EGT4288826.1 hypothetical protein [Cronobacter malonaticus]EGT4297392.1 hypothetical protein [Cronobacter malonaticus]
MGRLLSGESGIVPQGNDATTPRTAQTAKPCAMARKIFITQGNYLFFLITSVDALRLMHSLI